LPNTGAVAASRFWKWATWTAAAFRRSSPAASIAATPPRSWPFSTAAGSQESTGSARGRHCGFLIVKHRPEDERECAVTYRLDGRLNLISATPPDRYAVLHRPLEAEGKQKRSVAKDQPELRAVRRF